MQSRSSGLPLVDCGNAEGARDCCGQTVENKSTMEVDRNPPRRETKVDAAVLQSKLWCSVSKEEVNRGRDGY